MPQLVLLALEWWSIFLVSCILNVSDPMFESCAHSAISPTDLAQSSTAVFQFLQERRFRAREKGC
jgi:hypothetical protein